MFRKLSENNQGIDRTSTECKSQDKQSNSRLVYNRSFISIQEQRQYEMDNNINTDYKNEEMKASYRNKNIFDRKNIKYAAQVQQKMRRPQTGKKNIKVNHNLSIQI